MQIAFTIELGNVGMGIEMGRERQVGEVVFEIKVSGRLNMLRRESLKKSG